jgi:RNA polymerase sigma-70 factor (ECF subfamily)
VDTRDPDAFRTLFREHHPTVRRYLTARAPASEVDDLAAETFLIAWRRAAELPPHTLPWLLNVAAKVLANQRRREERADALVRRLADLPTLAVSTTRPCRELPSGAPSTWPFCKR